MAEKACAEEKLISHKHEKKFPTVFAFLTVPLRTSPPPFRSVSFRNPDAYDIENQFPCGFCGCRNNRFFGGIEWRMAKCRKLDKHNFCCFSKNSHYTDFDIFRHFYNVHNRLIFRFFCRTAIAGLEPPIRRFHIRKPDLHRTAVGRHHHIRRKSVLSLSRYLVRPNNANKNRRQRRARGVALMAILFSHFIRSQKGDRLVWSICSS